MKKIAWEKWQTEEIKEEIEEIQDGHEGFIESEEIHEISPLMMFDPSFGLPIPKIKTPMGAYDVDDPLCPTKMFECWVGHTNFRITLTDYSIMDSVNGLGCMRVISPNRFFIGIEKMFQFKDLRIEIEKLLCHEKEESLQELIHRLCKTKSKWAIFVGADGKIQTLTEQEEGYQKKLNALKKMKDGNIITCDDV